MNRVYVNLGIGCFWLFSAGLAYLFNSLTKELLAVCIILAVMFFWSAFRIYLNPNLAKKDKQNIVQKITDPNYKNTRFNKKK